MKTQKVTLKIEASTLDIASAKALLLDLISNLDREVEHGMLNMGDGDKIEWNTSRKDIEI